jgi:hypothetical protein
MILLWALVYVIIGLTLLFSGLAEEEDASLLATARRTRAETGMAFPILMIVWTVIWPFLVLHYLVYRAMRAYIIWRLRRLCNKVRELVKDDPECVAVCDRLDRALDGASGSGDPE